VTKTSVNGASRPYYNLLEQSAPGQPWSIQFGDYSRQCVEFERRDMAEKARFLRTGERYRILRTADTQAAIYAGLAALNRSL
jgi:hypothetical protein